ncbi:MAG: CPBP family intramembrane metalloprotease, partial [Parcubacteria group bacterium]|nr:CPBP family intramembrane metalloprotease [Parcubacteria group bacterium]
MNAQKKETSPLGLVSMIGTFALLAFIAYQLNLFGIVTHELFLFISGNANAIERVDTNLLAILGVILTVIVIELPCSIGASIIQNRVLGKSKNHTISNFFDTITYGSHFASFFKAVGLEELLARWLFLGLLTRIPFLSGTIAFYGLFLVGNGLWSYIHLSNYKEVSDRKLLRVLPQFVAGIFFAYLFKKYGLFAAVLGHFMSNAILFASHKIQKFNKIDVLIIVYSALCAVISFSL